MLNGYAELKLHQYLQTHEGLSWHSNKTRLCLFKIGDTGAEFG